MPKWVPVPKPDAELTVVHEGGPPGVFGKDTIVYVTANGVRFARVEDKNHVVTWWQAVEE